MGNRRRQRQVEAHPDKGIRVADAETFDDDPLPSEDKLLALHNIDPTILPWVKARLEEEQDLRHEIIRRRTSIAEKAQDTASRTAKTDGTYKILAMVVASLLLIGCCVAAFVLILNGQKLGALFIGGPVMMVVAAIIDGRRSKPKSGA
jgi:uncharacterized membrane protein